MDKYDRSYCSKVICQGCNGLLISVALIYLLISVILFDVVATDIIVLSFYSANITSIKTHVFHDVQICVVIDGLMVCV